MKTALEYLQEAYDKIKAKQSSKHEDVDPPILMAMREYAQQEAIAFYKWVDQNFISVTFDEDEGEDLYEAYLPKDYPEKNTYYILELYKIWKDERAKNM